MSESWHYREEPPNIDTPAVREAAAAIEAVYKYSCVGGNCHNVIDDGNLEDHNIDWCENSMKTENFHDAGPDQLRAEARCLKLLRGLTMDERASALIMSDRRSTDSHFA